MIPFVKAQEPLSVEIEAFLDAVLEGRENAGMGKLPMNVAAVLEAIDKSIKKNGSPVKVET